MQLSSCSFCRWFKDRKEEVCKYLGVVPHASLNICVRSRQILGVRRIFARKKFWPFFVRIFSHEDRISDDAMGAIFSNHSTLGAIFARIFLDFVQIFRDFARILRDFANVFTDFAQISMDFARIFTKSELLGMRFHPPAPRLLHHCH